MAEEEGGQEVEEDEYERGTRGKGNDKGGPRTPQQCGIWRVLVSMSASRQHAMQFSCRLHHQSVFSHEAAHRATGLSPCPPTPPYPIRQPIPAPRSRSTWLENALCVPSASFSSFSFSTRLLTLFFSLALGRRDSVVLRRSSPSPDAGHKLQASPDMSGPPRREIRGIPSSGIACAYPPLSSLFLTSTFASISATSSSISSSSSFFSSPAPRCADATYEDIKRSSLPTPSLRTLVRLPPPSRPTHA